MALPLALPAPPDEKLARSPLRLVVCQVRHERIMAVADVSRALEIHEAVRSLFPRIEEITEEQIDVVVGSEGGEVKRTEPLQGWRLQSADQKWTAVISQSYFSIETIAYNRWTDFKDRLAVFARSIAKAFSPKLENRLGLRMIDQIEYPNPSTPTGFKGLIIDDILGPIANADLSHSVKSTQSLVELEGSDGVTINLQHGCKNFEGTYSYVLDHDCFRQVGRPFSVDTILDTADKFHDLTKQVFRAVITEELYEYLLGNTK